MAEVAAHNKLPVRDFVRPDGIVEKQIDAISGLLPGPHTSHTITEVFKADDVPTDTDATHIRAGIEDRSGKLWQPGCGDIRGAGPGASPSPAPTIFFFKQKTAYEFGLGIPAEPLSDLCLIFKLAPSVCRMTFPILASLLVRLVVLLPFQLLRLSLATPSRWTPLALSVFLHCVVALLLTLL